MKFGILAPTALTALAVMLYTAPASAQTTTQKQTICRDGKTVQGTAADVCAGHGGLRVAASKTVHRSVTCNDSTVVATKEGCVVHNGVHSTTDVTHTVTATKKRGRPDDRDSTGAIAQCKDGMYSHVATRSAACKEHGGVEHYLQRAK